MHLQNSIPIQVADEAGPAGLVNNMVRFFRSKVLRLDAEMPPAIPQFVPLLPDRGLRRIASAFGRWTPAFARRLYNTDVVDVLATELSQRIVEEAVAEALSTIRRVVFYRYYHVFRQGELEELAREALHRSGRVAQSAYDSANWSLLVEKQ